MTKMFFRLAKKEMKNYIILDKDPDRVAEAIQGGYKAIKDDASRHDTLERFRTVNSKVTILCMSHDDVENIYITLNAKSISRDIKVIARAGSFDMIKKYERAGADHILLPNEVASRMMMSAILRPRVYEAIHGILTGDEKALLDEIDISRHSKLIGRKVKDIDFRGFRLLFIGINKGDSGEFIFNPDREVELQMGDTLLVMGHRINIEYFREMSFTENV
jgi:voltage-gated potassium channel